MERYTYRTPDGTALLTDKLDGRYTANEVIDELAARLAAYEETELDPDSIKALVRMCAAMKMEIDRLRAWESATVTNVGSKKSLLFSKRARLADLSEKWNRENGVKECAFSTITYLHANDLIDTEKALAFLESAAKEKEDTNHGQD